jgi:hypothetical protein
VGDAFELGDGEAVEVDVGVVGGGHDCRVGCCCSCWCSIVLWWFPMALNRDFATSSCDLIHSDLLTIGSGCPQGKTIEDRDIVEWCDR